MEFVSFTPRMEVDDIISYHDVVTTESAERRPAGLLVFGCQPKRSSRSYHKPLTTYERRRNISANGADGISDIEGKVARVATSKLGNERVSNSTSALSTMQCSSSARYRCPLSPRGSTVSSPKAAKALTRIWSKQVSDCPAFRNF